MTYQADCNIQFIDILENLNVVVPPRGRQRATEHCEKWTIHSALSILHFNGFINFPISIKKSEKPDYWVDMSGETYGVELTEIIHPDYAKVQTLPEFQCDKSVSNPSLFKWQQAKRNTKELKKIAALRKVTGLPWMGDSVEREFAQSIADTVAGKQKKLFSHYKRADVDILLIYHNQPSPMLDVNKGLEYTNEKLSNFWEKGFEVVAVIKYEKLFWLTKHSTKLLELES